jgi:hypothetical protein
MNDLVDAKKVKDRSPNFPFITLQQALDRARQFYAEEKRGVAPFSRAVMHWRYGPASSGGIQTAAALKSYGLLTEIGGSGAARQFQLTELALRIILDNRPDSEEKARFVAEAALKPNVAATVYSHWPDGLPSDSTINHFLVLELRFNEPSAIKVVKILKENHTFAGLDGLDTISLVAKNGSRDDMEPMPPQQLAASAAPQAPRAPVRAQAYGGGMSPMNTVNASGIAEHVLLPNGQSMTLQFNQVPDALLYETLRSFIDWKLKLFADAAKASKALALPNSEGHGEAS